jgi:hypothetical protein
MGSMRRQNAWLNGKRVCRGNERKLRNGSADGAASYSSLTDGRVIEEDLSLAYIQAVAGRVNVDVAFTRRDMGVDGTFRQLVSYESRRCHGPFSIDFQLKASVRWDCDDAAVKYDLKADAHNMLVRRNSEYAQTLRGAPLLLLLLCMPRSQDHWIDVSEEELLLRKCCYWAMLHGSPTQNAASVRIEIPRRQTLTPDSLLELFDRVEAGTLA